MTGRLYTVTFEGELSEAGQAAVAALEFAELTCAGKLNTVTLPAPDAETAMNLVSQAVKPHGLFTGWDCQPRP